MIKIRHQDWPMSMWVECDTVEEAIDLIKVLAGI